ncbi:sensor histidine kinase [Alteromonas sp. ASW11-130]|uniref:sensor histidine kinase n=1 Tax=Alteromonas sp. ASW11-130 TaxID=3015775 RepID=UPI0022428CFD|nr:HAMP domain-containing sensor histidine kinase [Alteromonas sp. ASW11-130]MCW8092268.1 HAMP domain-containing histidine kinase [Alteromonas sp. ASW11-130]
MIKSIESVQMDDFNANSNIDFSSVLAAAVHDMKNSLCLLIQSIENLSDSIPKELDEAHCQVANVHYEASRLNMNLVQMLSLYRAQLETLPTTVDEHFIADLFEDVTGSNALYSNQRKVSIDVNVDSELRWYLDGDLIYMLINDVVVNALRYGTSRIRLSAKVENSHLVISVEDDGPGYPEEMLINSNTELSDFHVSQGRTGLGLFFARLIAAAHTRGKNCGTIALSNGGDLGGSVFVVNLP